MMSLTMRRNSFASAAPDKEMSTQSASMFCVELPEASDSLISARRAALSSPSPSPSRGLCF